jgi:hypothetical protein
VNNDLLTVRADNIFDMKARLDDMAELIGPAQSVSVLAQGAASAASVTAPAAVPAAPTEQYAQPAPPPPAPAAPAASGVPTPTCAHGQRTHRSGSSAKGPWSAWFCPTPKGTADQCEPVWG